MFTFSSIVKLHLSILLNWLRQTVKFRRRCFTSVFVIPLLLALFAEIYTLFIYLSFILLTFILIQKEPLRTGILYSIPYKKCDWPKRIDKVWVFAHNVNM